MLQTGNAHHTQYDAVIATRNRPEALALSIPLLIGQSCPPQRLIVIDSSDDHAHVAAVVSQVAKDWGGEVIVRQSAPGISYQRNRGLELVVAPIVLFPDDDSLLHPGAAEALLEIYARDTESDIAAVGAIGTRQPPEGVLADDTWEISQTHRREASLRTWRHRIEARIGALKPALFLGRQLNGRHTVPEWLSALDAVPVEYMTGYRMSFRTDAIRATGFDEALGGYALDEDIDASFQVMASGLVVASRRARIYHHRFPSGRGDGAQLGRMEVLNRIYVALKHSRQSGLPAGTAHQVRQRLRGFLALKLVASLPGAHSAFGRARLRGAWAAIMASSQIWRAADDQLAAAYKAALDRATKAS